MITDILPPEVLELLDETNMLSNNMELIPTSVGLRQIYLQDIIEKESGIKPFAFLNNPLVAQIEFTQHCNLKCDFCYNDSGPSNIGELEPKLLRRICEELVDMEIFELIISGGEALTRPKHVDVIFEIFKGTGIPIHLLSNGILLSHKWLDYLEKQNVVSIQVSLDGGDPEVHDRHRRKRGAWGLTMAALGRAHDHGFHTIAACTLTKKNADSISDLIDQCFVASADCLSIGDLISWGRARDWSRMDACTNEQYDHITELVMAVQNSYGEWIRVEQTGNMLIQICKLCIRNQESILIRGNGDVHPHCILAGIRAGNVHESSLRDIWDNNLKQMSKDRRVIEILNSFQVVRTERLGQLRCIPKDTA
ncbi:radical SAM protein [bacterium]|nr:radical SAM protein [bacterium]